MWEAVLYRQQSYGVQWEVVAHQAHPLCANALTHLGRNGSNARVTLNGKLGAFKILAQPALS